MQPHPHEDITLFSEFSYDIRYPNFIKLTRKKGGAIIAFLDDSPGGGQRIIAIDAAFPINSIQDSKTSFSLRTIRDKKRRQFGRDLID
jgi:hypothetical protein